MLSKYFKTFEFVPKDLYKKLGDRSMRYINPKLVIIVDYLREKYGRSITINNWYLGGKLQYRGFRPFITLIGSYMSDHKYGNALDFNVNGMSSDEVWDSITGELYKELLELGLTAVEDKAFTTTWTHISVADFEYYDLPTINGIKIIKP